MKIWWKFLFSILILSFVAAGVSAQPIITVSQHTIPEKPVTGDFILSVDLQNTGGNARNLKLFLYENEDGLSILRGGEEVSSVFLTLGDLATGSSSAQVKMRAEKAGIYEIHARINYDYGEYLYKASINRIIALRVIDEPQFSVSKELTIEPSKTEKYNLNVLNNGGRAKDVSISMSTPDKIVSNLGKVAFDSWESNEQKELDFSLTADKSVGTGVYQMNLHLSYSNEFGEPHSETISIPLRVKGTPQLIISEMSTTPERVFPEDEFTLNMGVENSGTSNAENVRVSLKVPESFEGEGTKFLGTVNRDSTKTAKFNLKAKNETTTGDHTFTLDMSYEDDSGKAYSSTTDFPLFVSSPGRISLDIAGIFTSPDTPTEGDNYKLSLQVENSGNQDAKAVSLKLDLPPGFKGRNSYFIGSLESGDSATASFDLTAGSSGDHDIEVDINYMDTTFEQHKVTRSFSQYIEQKSYLGQIVAIVVLLIVLAFVGYRYKWRKK